MPHQLFEAVLSKAYTRERNARKKMSEPRFVRELISTATIRGLNRAAAAAYDPSLGQIKFRGGYLHAKPYARWNATWTGNGSVAAGSKSCSRELADALFVLYETAPHPVTRRHRVVRRSACMLMFKRDHTTWPHAPAFVPGADPLPGGRGSSDKEQFYLYNKWPPFRLEEGAATAPTFSHPFNLGGPVLHDIGKYALVWDGKKSERWEAWNPPALAFPTSWLYAPPLPNHPIHPGMLSADSGSLGYLLERCIEGGPAHGRDFKRVAWPASLAPRQYYGWDELMAFLLGYSSWPKKTGANWKGHLADGYYYGKNNSRDIYPAIAEFMGYTGPQLERSIVRLGNMGQYWRDSTPRTEALLRAIVKRRHGPILPKRGEGIRFMQRGRHGRDHGGGSGLPVLVAAVNHFASLEEKHAESRG